MAPSARMNVRFDLFVDRPYVMARIEAWRLRILGRTGAYGRGTIRKQFRPQKQGVRFNTVTVFALPALLYGPTAAAKMTHARGRHVRCHVHPKTGLVIDADTGRPVTKALAKFAREAMQTKRGRDNAGKPPRRGPTDKLRQFTDFGVDPDTESVVAGPWPFPTQPELVGAVSVPELLDNGGFERHGNTYVKYDPHPYLERSLEPTRRFMEKLIESNPIGGSGTFGIKAA
jgi:hypothetical protein